MKTPNIPPLKKLTPMMEQYYSIKAENQDAVLFFRMGDFYEMFGEDAKEVSHLIDLTLTQRSGIEMCGLPYHSAQTHIRKLLKLGKKVAICEQVSLPEKGLAKREVVEIISPGTIVDGAYLDDTENNFLLALCQCSGGYSLAYCDLSTGEFMASSFLGKNATNELRHELSRLQTKEIIIPDSLAIAISEGKDGIELQAYFDASRILLNKQPDWTFDHQQSLQSLKHHFSVLNLKGFSLSETDPAIISAGVILRYVEANLKGVLHHLRSLRSIPQEAYVGLDDATQRNLELLKSLNNEGQKYTLFSTLNDTKTAMGARLLKKWILHPLRQLKAIEQRQKMVSLFYNDSSYLSVVRERLGSVVDCERLLAKVATDKAHAKDLLGIRNSLIMSDELIQGLLTWHEDLFLRYFYVEMQEDVKAIKDLLQMALLEEPSLLLTEGKLLRYNYNSELDSVKKLSENRQQILSDYLEEEREKTGIANLKLKYNKVIGYFFELTNSQKKLVPEHFIRRQTLVNGERFTSIRLGELEKELDEASGKLFQLEKALFLDLREKVKSKLANLLNLCETLAKLDVYQSFAYTATLRSYCLPKVHEGINTHIVKARHPVVEASLSNNDFVENSLEFDKNHLFSLITGPNMAGKSTYLRQNALLILMAQIGSYIPAEEAEIGIADHIFCRVGASDNLARGESTFLVEMNETAYILNTASAQSLIIMDEVGRGTSTEDGLSIAWAVCEYILNKLRTRTLFATHFHELTRLDHPLLKNLSLEVREDQGKIWFLKRVIEQAADSSYGIHVASLAGVPLQVIQRANMYRSQSEDSGERMEPKMDLNLEFVEPSVSWLEVELKKLNLNEMTPLKAIETLNYWQEQLS